MKPYLLTHTGLLNIDFMHNHPLTSAHTLSFRDVLEETKHTFYSYFELGHSASSAHHAHEQAVYMEANSEADAQNQMADRAQNPLLQDICGLFCIWRENINGKDGKNFLSNFKGRWMSIIEKTKLMEERLSYSSMKLHCLKWTMNMKKRNHQQSERSENFLRSH